MPTAWKQLRQGTKSSGFRAAVACISKPVHHELWVSAAKLSSETGISEALIAEYTERNLISHLPGTDPHYRVSRVIADLEAIEAQSLINQSPVFLTGAGPDLAQASA